MARHKCRDCGAVSAIECDVCHNHFCGKHKRIHYDLEHNGRSRKKILQEKERDKKTGYKQNTLPSQPAGKGRQPHRDSL